MAKVQKRKFISLEKLHERRKKNLGNSSVFSLKFRSDKPSTIQEKDLRKSWPAIYDQGQIGSCTANAFCAVFNFLNKHKPFEPSRMYVYYKERWIESQGGVVSDSGAFVEDGCQWVSSHGVCSESQWPYDINNVNVAPPSQCDQEAEKHKIGKYFRLTMDANLKSSIKQCILNGYPVLMAFGVYNSFFSTGSDGLCPMPNPEHYEDYDDPVDPLEGGHEVAILGFDDSKKLFMVANSWGTSWGDQGFFYIPYAYVDNSYLVYDFAAILPFTS